MLLTFKLLFFGRLRRDCTETGEVFIKGNFVIIICINNSKNSIKEG